MSTSSTHHPWSPGEQWTLGTGLGTRHAVRCQGALPPHRVPSPHLSLQAPQRPQSRCPGLRTLGWQALRLNTTRAVWDSYCRTQPRGDWGSTQVVDGLWLGSSHALLLMWPRELPPLPAGQPAAAPGLQPEAPGCSKTGSGTCAVVSATVVGAGGDRRLSLGHSMGTPWLGEVGLAFWEARVWEAARAAEPQCRQGPGGLRASTQIPIRAGPSQPWKLDAGSSATGAGGRGGQSQSFSWRGLRQPSWQVAAGAQPGAPEDSGRRPGPEGGHVLVLVAEDAPHHADGDAEERQEQQAGLRALVQVGQAVVGDPGEGRPSAPGLPQPCATPPPARCSAGSFRPPPASPVGSAGPGRATEALLTTPLPRHCPLHTPAVAQECPSASPDPRSHLAWSKAALLGSTRGSGPQPTRVP